MSPSDTWLLTGASGFVGGWLRRAIGTETTEETTFDRFRVNTKIDQRKFEPIK